MMINDVSTKTTAVMGSKTQTSGWCIGAIGCMEVVRRFVYSSVTFHCDITDAMIIFQGSSLDVPRSQRTPSWEIPV